jgi:2,3-diketo-5-methylthio-1-phosphopentane phosphatase
VALKLFVDFDGTIAAADIGNRFFRTFGGSACDEYVRDYRAGKISARECFRRETRALGRLHLPAVEEFLDAQEMVPGFADFVAFCRSRGVEFHVLSDGLDFYIDRFFRRHGISGISRYANTFSVNPATGEPAIEFPHADAECDRCACCKRNIMLALCGDDDVIGYIGEGFSDRCPAQHADLVFAKDELQVFCQRENISYYPYTTFVDVVHRLARLLERKTLRHRRRAELKRRETYQRES